MTLSAAHDTNTLASGLSTKDGHVQSGLGARWYALQTSARHEKRVTERLIESSIECFLPQYEKVSRWKDRRVRLSLPLFPGYVFVRIALRERLRVLKVPGAACLVGFGGQPVPLPEGEIEKLRDGLNGLRPQPHPFLRAGQRVQITDGPLAGMEGILLRHKGFCRVVLSLDLIQSSVSVDVDSDLVYPVFATQRRRLTTESRER